MTGDRDALWSRLQATSFLTDDEKRAAIGYGPKPAAAVTQKFNPYHDDRGRFDFAPNGPAEDDPDAPVTPDFTDPDNPNAEPAAKIFPSSAFPETAAQVAVIRDLDTLGSNRNRRDPIASRARKTPGYTSAGLWPRSAGNADRGKPEQLRALVPAPLTTHD